MLRSNGARAVSEACQHASRAYISRAPVLQPRHRAQLAREGAAAYKCNPVLPGYNVAAISTDSRENKGEPPARPGFLSKEASVADPNFKNRWAMVLPAFMMHAAIGSPYAWSIMSSSITREVGVVAPTGADWSMDLATMPLSIVFAALGLSAAMGGGWAARVGPRKALGLASLLFGGGTMLGGLGIELQSLPLLYAGYGAMAGCGVGLAYTPPVQALISWFPDKKGLASGMAIAGFGSGALVFTPAIQYLMDKFSKIPDYLGPASSVDTIVEHGRLLAQVGDALREVVVVNHADVSRLPYDVAEGVYVVGTGTTGAGPALCAMGAAYTGLMLASAFALKTPPKGYKPAGWDPAVAAAKGGAVAVAAPVRSVTADEAVRTPQFHQLGAVLVSLACGGMSLIAASKPMMSDVFSSSLPAIVTAGFASQYVQMLAAGNLGGRIGWAAFSDRFGRAAAFKLFTLGSIPLYLAIPPLIDAVVTTQSPLPLAAFIGATTLAVTFYGGAYSVLPAYEADLFGAKHVGPIHGRMLLYTSAAALSFPLLLRLRALSEAAATRDLLQVVDPARFQEYFHAPMSAADELIASKALTIAKLMDICPPGTVDPTPYLYNTTMYTAAGLVAAAAVSHSLLRPISTKYFEGAKAKIIEAIPKPHPSAHRAPGPSMPAIAAYSTKASPERTK